MMRAVGQDPETIDFNNRVENEIAKDEKRARGEYVSNTDEPINIPSSFYETPKLGKEITDALPYDSNGELKRTNERYESYRAARALQNGEAAPEEPKVGHSYYSQQLQQPDATGSQSGGTVTNPAGSQPSGTAADPMGTAGTAPRRQGNNKLPPPERPGSRNGKK